MDCWSRRRHGLVRLEVDGMVGLVNVDSAAFGVGC